MSIETVAQQLKLAPRQVKALEEGDYTHLPGRTFVRGFVRNYARLLQIDPERVLGTLPAGAAAPALEAPMLQQTAQTMGELPTNEHSKSGWTRWAIPMTLAAIVAAAAAYEWSRPPGESRAPSSRDPIADVERPAPTAKHEATVETPGTMLQNPLAARSPDSPAAPPAASSAPPSTTSSNPVASASHAPATAAPPAPTTSATPAAAAGGAIADQLLMFSFRDYSWTEVRDRNGRVLLSRMNSGGTAQSVSGTPPLEIVIGNAADVSVRYKGQPVDLAPYTRRNVARFTLP